MTFPCFMEKYGSFENSSRLKNGSMLLYWKVLVISVIFFVVFSGNQPMFDVAMAGFHHLMSEFQTGLPRKRDDDAQHFLGIPFFYM